jgi:two-component system, OmpR family, KDP operon response regulator KdpE
MNDTRVLVVDDEDRFRQSLARSLRGNSFEVFESATGTAALTDAFTCNPDVILLDLMLPDIDGVTVCQEVRRRSQVAIIVVSVLADEPTKVRALNTGADDYLTKPFGSGELLARIGAVLRRTGSGAEDGVFEAGPLRVEIDNHRASLYGEELLLTPLEFAILRVFAINAGKILRQDTILQTVWGDEHVGDSERLRTAIKQLRAKLGDSSTHPRFIRTEPGVGYRFIHTPQ